MIAQVSQSAANLQAVAPEAPTDDRTPIQVITDYDKDLRDRSAKLCQVQGFLDFLKDELESGALKFDGDMHTAWYAMERIKALTA